MAVNISSYAAFKNEVLGKAYDPDGVYGAQCVDGANLLWIALGRWIDCGGDNARGIWSRRKEKNAGNDFDLIYDANQLKVGDVIVWGNGAYGHVGYVDSIGNGYVGCLGQNQKGNGSGYPFTIVNISLNGFLGAFRLKRWHTTVTPEPAPAPTPTPEPTPAPEETPAPESSTLKEGDMARPLTLVDYDGRRLRAYRDAYTVKQIRGDRVVLGTENGIWAAMKMSDVAKV